jgi:hypothetical protein
MKHLIATGTLALLLAAPAMAQTQGSPINSGSMPPPTGGIPGGSLGGIDNGLYSNGSSNPTGAAVGNSSGALRVPGTNGLSNVNPPAPTPSVESQLNAIGQQPGAQQPVAPNARGSGGVDSSGLASGPGLNGVGANGVGSNGLGTAGIGGAIPGSPGLGTNGLGSNDRASLNPGPGLGSGAAAAGSGGLGASTGGAGTGGGGAGGGGGGR